MKYFLRVAGAIVGLGNDYLLITGLGSPATYAKFVAEEGWSGVPRLLVLTALGLLTAEVLLRWMRPALEGRFFVRYATMVGAMFGAGLLYGGTLMFVAGLVAGGTPDVFVYVPGAIERILTGLVLGLLGTLFGGFVGMLEGLILGFPLAALLGLFRGTGSRPEGTAT